MPIGTLSNFPQGFSNGLTIRGMPLLQAQPGQVFWLNNSSALLPQQRAGSDGNRGTYLDPFATLNYAVSQCVAGRGDVIMVGPGHAETITTATAVALTISGVAILGMGSGNLRPTFTFSTVIGATIGIQANGISFTNCVFIANFLNITSVFTLTTATDFALFNCEIKDTSAILNFVTIITQGTTSNLCDGLTLVGNKISSLATTGANNLMTLTATTDRIFIDSNKYLALTTNAGAVMPFSSGKIATNAYITNNFFNLQNAAGTATAYLITTNSSTNTGFIANNVDHALPTTPLLVTASSGFVYNNNLHSDAADLQGYLVPAADS